MGDMDVTKNEVGSKREAKDFHPPETPQKTEAGSNEASIKPLRTLVGDISSIIKDQHLSNSALNILDKKLREEIETYERSGGDKRIAEILKTASIENENKKNKNTGVPSEPRTFTHIPHLEKPTPVAEERKSEAPPAPHSIPPAHNEHQELLVVQKEEDGAEAARMILEKHREAEVARKSEAESRKEMMRRREQELADEDGKLREQARLLEEAIAVIPHMRSRNEEAMQKPLREREELMKLLASVHEKEQRAEDEEHQYEEAEIKSAGPEERQKAEINRARAGDLREAVERERFEIDEKIARAENELHIKTEALVALEENEKKLKAERADIAKRQTAVQKERAWFGLRERIAEIEKLKESIEMNWIVLNEKKKQVEALLAPVLSRERELEEKKRGIEMKEASADGPAARHQIENERWEIERERRKAEEERWKFEKEIEVTARPMRELGAKYQKLLEEEERSAEELRTTPPGFDHGKEATTPSGEKRSYAA